MGTPTMRPMRGPQIPAHTNTRPVTTRPRGVTILASHPRLALSATIAAGGIYSEPMAITTYGAMARAGRTCAPGTRLGVTLNVT